MLFFLGRGGQGKGKINVCVCLRTSAVKKNQWCSSGLLDFGHLGKIRKQSLCIRRGAGLLFGITLTDAFDCFAGGFCLGCFAGCQLVQKGFGSGRANFP